MTSLASFALARTLQSPSTSTMIQNNSMNGKVIISALVILFFIVFFIILLHVYAKWLQRSAGGSHLHHSPSSRGIPLTGAALDREIVKALPIFTYKSPCLSKATYAEAVECVVCLSDFRHDESCKLLPKCKHFFHIECIEMWFLSNTTCPLCRTVADPHSDCGEVHDVGGSMSCYSIKQDEGHELGELYQRPVMPAATLGCTRDGIACDNSDDTLSRGHFSLQSPASFQNYRRSKSEKFSQSAQGTPLATNVLFWGNHTGTSMGMKHTHRQTGRRSFSHTAIDILKAQESLVDDSSYPALPGSPELYSNLSQLVHGPVACYSSHERGFLAASSN